MTRNEQLRRLLAGPSSSVELDALTGRNRRHVRLGLWVLSGLKTEFGFCGVSNRSFLNVKDDACG